MQKDSVAKKYVFVLIFSLLPFFVGITYSLMQSSDRAYYSAAINISGSQRMRTMLLSNYSQLYVETSRTDDSETLERTREILVKEKGIYEDFYKALLSGNPALKMKAPYNGEIRQALRELDPYIKGYLMSLQAVLVDPQNADALKSITDNALYIKDNYHMITELFQQENDGSIARQRILDVAMIVLAALITVSGLLLTNRIRQQEYHAYFDFLTKLKNRHSFYQDIKDKDPTQYSVFFIDLNKFKVINDTYGHQTGDEILIGVAEKLRATFDPDWLYRYGGDEFIALLPENGDRNRIDEKIEMLKLRLAEPIIDTNQRRHFVGLALGVVSAQVGIASWDTLISLSDDLMYDSKSIAGHVIVYRSKADLDYRLKLIGNVDHVFTNGLISLTYSPIISISEAGNAFYNVTSRWVDGERVFKAKEFLPLLKRKGYLPMLDKNTILRIESDLKEMTQASDWESKKPCFIVSITEDTLINAHENRFLDLVSNADIPKGRIYFKVQDEWLRDRGMVRQLKALKDRGFSVAIDLNRLELSLGDSAQYGLVDLVKLGNGLVRTLMSTGQTKVLLKEFVNMLTDLHLTVVLEGFHSRSTLRVSVAWGSGRKDWFISMVPMGQI